MILPYRHSREELLHKCLQFLNSAWREKLVYHMTLTGKELIKITYLITTALFLNDALRTLWKASSAGSRWSSASCLDEQTSPFSSPACSMPSSLLSSIMSAGESCGLFSHLCGCCTANIRDVKETPLRKQVSLPRLRQTARASGRRHRGVGIGDERWLGDFCGKAGRSMRQSHRQSPHLSGGPAF